MLGRKRGGAADKRKMAKKGAALQTEVNNDEEWEKILQRSGLVLVDVYSEWSGPCAGMVSVLKKIKMEIGGDDLSYAIAKCDHITSLSRFRGRSEPIWMFIRNGHTVNIAFGANCPQLSELLTQEIRRVQKNEPPEFSVSVDEVSDKEAARMAAVLDAKNRKEAALNAKKEEAARKRYEAYMDHLKSSLLGETCMILFPWCFKDEEGNKRDKKSSPQYTEMVEILQNKFNIEAESRRVLDEETVDALQKETELELAEETKQLLLDGFCFVFRLKLLDSRALEDMDAFLINLFYEEREVPEVPYALVEGCFVQRHMPPQYALGDNESEGDVAESVSDKTILLTTLWVPVNPRNRVIAIKSLFPKYVESNYPFEDSGTDVALMLFKYDSTKKNELEAVYNEYSAEVTNFGVFERDKTPDPILIADSIQTYEKKDVSERSGYEVFVAVVKKVNNEAFLSFAGIGPYHVSENPDVALEEIKMYFPTEKVDDNENEEDQDEDKEGEEKPSEDV